MARHLTMNWYVQHLKKQYVGAGRSDNEGECMIEEKIRKKPEFKGKINNT